MSQAGSALAYQMTQICALIEPGGFAAEKLMLNAFIEDGTAVEFGRALSVARDQSLQPGEKLPFGDDRLASTLNGAICLITINLTVEGERARLFILFDGSRGVTARIGLAGWLSVTVWDETPEIDVDAVRQAQNGVVEVSFALPVARRGYAWDDGGRSALLEESGWIYSTSDVHERQEQVQRTIGNAIQDATQSRNDWSSVRAAAPQTVGQALRDPAQLTSTNATAQEQTSQN